MAHKRVGQVGRAISFSKFFPSIDPERVSQVEMATSFSKFYHYLPLPTLHKNIGIRIAVALHKKPARLCI